MAHLYSSGSYGIDVLQSPSGNNGIYTQSIYIPTGSNRALQIVLITRGDRFKFVSASLDPDGLNEQLTTQNGWRTYGPPTGELSLDSMSLAAIINPVSTGSVVLETSFEYLGFGDNDLQTLYTVIDDVDISQPIPTASWSSSVTNSGSAGAARSQVTMSTAPYHQTIQTHKFATFTGDCEAIGLNGGWIPQYTRLGGDPTSIGSLSIASTGSTTLETYVEHFDFGQPLQKPTMSWNAAGMDYLQAPGPRLHSYEVEAAAGDLPSTRSITIPSMTNGIVIIAIAHQPNWGTQINTESLSVGGQSIGTNLGYFKGASTANQLIGYTINPTNGVTEVSWSLNGAPRHEETVVCSTYYYEYVNQTTPIVGPDIVSFISGSYLTAISHSAAGQPSGSDMVTSANQRVFGTAWIRSQTLPAPSGSGSTTMINNGRFVLGTTSSMSVGAYETLIGSDGLLTEVWNGNGGTWNSTAFVLDAATDAPVVTITTPMIWGSDGNVTMIFGEPSPSSLISE